MLKAVSQPLVDVAHVRQVLASLGQDPAFGLTLLSLAPGSARVTGVAAVRKEFAELHNPVVDVVSPPPLHLVVGRSSCSANRIMTRVLVENDFETQTQVFMLKSYSVRGNGFDTKMLMLMMSSPLSVFFLVLGRIRLQGKRT